MNAFSEKMAGRDDDALAFEAFVDESRGRSGLGGSILLLTIVAFLVVAFLWAMFTELDEVTRGQGKVVPSSSLQVVESLEGGVVTEIRVRQGERVAAGDILMVLDGGLFEGEYRTGLERQYALEARRERLRSEADDSALQFSDALLVAAPNMVAAERELYQGRQQELASELRVLERQIGQRRQELESLEVTARTAAEGIALAEQEAALIEPLVAQGVEPELSLIQIRRTLSDLRGQLARARTDAAGVRAAISEAEERLQSARDVFRSEALAELSETAGELAALGASLPARADQLARTRVRAPVDGIVNRVHINTIGGVANPGDPLVEVVPEGDNLLIEAQIRPEDIAFLRPGQPAKVKLTAYDFARYGGLDGEIVTIGADAVEVSQNPPEVAYMVEVRTEGHLEDADGEPLEVIPGMVAQVDILSGKRSVLDYLLEPVVKVRDRALRD